MLAIALAHLGLALLVEATVVAELVATESALVAVVALVGGVASGPLNRRRRLRRGLTFATLYAASVASAWLLVTGVSPPWVAAAALLALFAFASVVLARYQLVTLDRLERDDG